MPLVKKSSIRFRDISLRELCKRLEANPEAVLLDVRSAEEFNGTTQEVESFGHFIKAINVNVQELEQRIGELTRYRDSEIIVYCSHSHRSPRASYLLGQHGFNNVTNMSGGVSTFPQFPNRECLTEEFSVHTN